MRRRSGQGRAHGGPAAGTLMARCQVVDAKLVEMASVVLGRGDERCASNHVEASLLLSMWNRFGIAPVSQLR